MTRSSPVHSRVRALPAAAVALLLLDCALDFRSAVPCEDDTQCNEGWHCDLTFGRCMEGGGSGDVADAGSDAIGRRDTDSDDSVSDSSGDAPADLLQTDLSPLDAATDGSGVSDLFPVDAATDTPDCVPAIEICDGIDNDCDLRVDEDAGCAVTCPDGAVLIDQPDFTAFCIDIWEASRPDATDSSPGVDESRATSRPGVLPWSGVPFATAEAACVASGRTLCSDDQWKRACGGPERRRYPYNQTTYDPNACNGVEQVRGGPATTGSFAGCLSPGGPLDMSGNLEEWNALRMTRGGSYSDVDFNMQCNSPSGEIVNPTTSGPQVGFRCCWTP